TRVSGMNTRRRPGTSTTRPVAVGTVPRRIRMTTSRTRPTGSPRGSNTEVFARREMYTRSLGVLMGSGYRRPTLWPGRLAKAGGRPSWRSGTPAHVLGGGDLSPHAQHGGRARGDIVRRGGRVAHRDAHGLAAVPQGAASPHRAFGLDCRDDRVRGLVIPKR